MLQAGGRCSRDGPLPRESLVVQGLGLQAFIAKGPGLIPGQGNYNLTSHEAMAKKKKKEKGPLPNASRDVMHGVILYTMRCYVILY